ncbi:MAG: DUF2169 domain-containing protein [Chitinivibrionales bacterium]|nr:DUF2169 domain-containing protein [Chitinivibrionales bacterium]MBD3394423.1 DUF2169 domain-containing protein [Chitinivibrionales bacterium]
MVMNWQTRFIPGSRPDGTPVLSLLAKRTYCIAPGSVTPADKQVGLCMQDTYDDPDNPLYAEVVAENDLIAYKPSTDVVIAGSARAPGGRRAYHVDCEASVGPLRKTIRVYGNRRARLKTFGGVSIEDPEPFERMSLGYRKAYGGTCRDRNGMIVSYFPNPIGIGFAVKGGIGEEADSLAVPNLEDPSSPVTGDNLVASKYEEWTSLPKPASLGWTRRNFYPRYTWAGVLPEYLEVAGRNRDAMAGKYPELAVTEIPRMDYRVFQGASEGLWGEQLAGDEPVSLTYLDPYHEKFQFDLPGERPHLAFDIGDGPVELEPVLQTVVIDKEKDLLTMLWRGCMDYGGIETLEHMPKFEFAAR